MDENPEREDLIMAILTAKEILDIKKRLNNIYVKHTGQKLKDVEKNMERDNFMSPEKALEFGIIDKIITNRNEIN